jgi:hypothetical protein
MIEHIVRMNEKVESILNTYQISLDELKENNLHITDFNHLNCGMKLLIPYLSKNVEQILESTEGFVQKYYPKISEVLEEKVVENKVEVLAKDEKVEVTNDRKDEKIVSKVKDDFERKKTYIRTIPPKKPYKGNIKI